MRYLLFVSCLALVLSLLAAAPAEARGGKGGGGRGPSNRGSGQRGGGGNKWNGQQAGQGGGASRQAGHELKPHGQGHNALANNKHDGDKEQDKEKEKEKEKGDRSKPTSNWADDAADAYNKKQKQLELAQRHRDKQLAQAQHLREIAEQNGNPNLLTNAERMEAAANEQYAKRVAHLEKFGVTDPTLNTGSVVSPVRPGRVLPQPGGWPADAIRDILPIRP